MATALQDHVSLLQTFLSNPTTTSPHLAAEATLHITRAAAQSTASKSAVTLAQNALATLSKSPCTPAIPHLLSICEDDPFEALDVFVLSSAAWKALVATVIAAPPEPHFAIRVISCAALNATCMIARCLQSATHTSSEVLRTVKIAKFYCLNAARCSKAFLTSIPHVPSKLLGTPFLNLFDFVSLTTFVLLFDHHALLPAHDELRSEVLPLVTRTLKILLAIMLNANEDQHQNVVRRALDSTGKHQVIQSLCLPPVILQLLAGLHTTRCLLDPNQDLYKTKQSKQSSNALVTSFLVPFLFSCFDIGYEELALFREQSGCAFLDTVIFATVDIISAALPCYETTQQSRGALDFLLQQVSSDNAIQSYVSQEALLHLASAKESHDTWRDPIIISVFACFRTSLSLNSLQTTRWQQLAVELCFPLAREGKHLAKLIAASRTPDERSEDFTKESSIQVLDDPVVVPLLAYVCQFITVHDRAREDVKQQAQTHEPLFRAMLRAFQLAPEAVTEHAKEMSLSSVGYAAECATAFLLHVLHVFDNTSALVCGSAISILQRDGSTAGMICESLNILHPSVMQPGAIDAVCAAATTAVAKHGIAVCAAVAGFVSKAAYCLGDTVSLAHWQKLSALLETCLTTSSRRQDPVTPRVRMIEGTILHYAALSLNGICRTNRNERQTAATLPSSILNDAQDALKRLDGWKAGDRGCDLAKERIFVTNERKYTTMEKDLHPSDKSKAIHSVRAAREHLLEAASLMLDGNSDVSINEETRSALSLLEHSIRSVARCHQRTTR